jgi:hypothetical protein
MHDFMATRLGPAASLAACKACGKSFAPRSTGGRPQRFCSVACRRADDAAARAKGHAQIERERERLPDVDNGCAATRALVTGATSPAWISPPRKPAPVALPEPPDEAAELLHELVIALLDLPGDGGLEIADKLPVDLLNRLCNYLDVPS